MDIDINIAKIIIYKIQPKILISTYDENWKENDAAILR